MNHRIRESGGLVWFNPAMSVTYRPRPTVKALARQYFEYGSWRREIMRRHDGTVEFRYLAPPAAVAAIATGTLLGLAGALRGSRALAAVGFAAPLGYVASVSIGGRLIGRAEPPSIRARVPIALATMHMAWGVGFLTSRRRIDKHR